jgi:predicted ATPase
MKNRFVVISGCSGGGKSTLLEELRRQGHGVIEEPGRRIVRMELERGGQALPWIDPEAFARKAIQVATEDLRSATTQPGWIFFDRGLVDAAVALQQVTNEHIPPTLGDCYYDQVFLAPPWPEIYVADSERRHSFADAVAEFDRLYAAYLKLGYRVILLPKESTRKRADLVVAALSPANVSPG